MITKQGPMKYLYTRTHEKLAMPLNDNPQIVPGYALAVDRWKRRGHERKAK